MDTPEGTTSGSEAAGVRLLSDAYKRWADAPPVRLGMNRQDAWIVMMGLQNTVSHPGLSGPLRERMTAVGRQIQEAVADTPELYALAEAGWNRAFDVDSSTEGN
jgi:hypothetical protein